MRRVNAVKNIEKVGSVKQKIKIFIVFAPVTIAALLAYNNCGSSHLSSEDSLSFSSGGSCDAVILQDFEKLVYPFFRREDACLSCHIEGGSGIGLFASADLQKSFAAFNSAGLTKISYMATNPQHKPPYTGEHHQATIDAFSDTYLTRETLYRSCKTRSENGGIDESILTAAKSAPQIRDAANSTQTLSWELDLAEDLDEIVTRPLPAQVTVDVQVLYIGVEDEKTIAGYIFSNPTLTMKDPNQSILIEGLFFQINRQPILSQTTFTNLSRVVTGSTTIPLYNAKANTFVWPVTNNDTFQLYIKRMTLTSGSDESPTPLTPILKVNGQLAGLTTLIRNRTANVSILRDAGVVRWCLTESATRLTSVDSACPNSVTGNGSMNGWQTSRPSSFEFSSGDGEKTLYLWVANQNLRLNESPAVVRVTLDTVAPAAPSIASINVTDSQVADMVVNHSNEADVAGWCVIEQNAIMANPAAPALNDDCWRWTDNNAKPATVGFREGGTRNVWVYVRDSAGNVSAPSNMRTATNSFGAVTFAQLTAGTGGPRAIFRNRCATCHETASHPGFTKLQLFSYAAAIGSAESGLLVSRINNATSPMPNVDGGLMPQRERDLIRLWTMPEEGDTPLP